MNCVRSSTAGLAILYVAADVGVGRPHPRFRRQPDDAHRTARIDLRENASQERRARLEMAGGVGGALPHRLHRLRGYPTAQPALGGLPGDATGDTRNRQRGTRLCPSPPGWGATGLTGGYQRAADHRQLLRLVVSKLTDRTLRICSAVRSVSRTRG